MIKESDEIFWLRMLSRGDERAFDNLFHKYYKTFCAYANFYLKDIDQAESLVQECFVKLWQRREEADKILNFCFYFRFIVRNKCLDFLRVKKLAFVEEDQLINQQGAASDEADSSLIAHDFEDHLVIAVGNLPERCRQAFEYSRFEGLSYSQIAQKMGISNKAVEALISRALKFIRLKLKDFLVLLVFIFIQSLFK